MGEVGGREKERASEVERGKRGNRETRLTWAVGRAR